MRASHARTSSRVGTASGVGGHPVADVEDDQRQDHLVDGYLAERAGAVHEVGRRVDVGAPLTDERVEVQVAGVAACRGHERLAPFVGEGGGVRLAGSEAWVRSVRIVEPSSSRYSAHSGDSLMGSRDTTGSAVAAVPPADTTGSAVAASSG